MTKLIVFLISIFFPEEAPSELEMSDRLEAMAVRQIHKERIRMIRRR